MSVGELSGENFWKMSEKGPENNITYAFNSQIERLQLHYMEGRNATLNLNKMTRWSIVNISNTMPGIPVKDYNSLYLVVMRRATIINTRTDTYGFSPVILWVRKRTYISDDSAEHGQRQTPLWHVDAAWQLIEFFHRVTSSLSVKQSQSLSAKCQLYCRLKTVLFNRGFAESM